MLFEYDKDTTMEMIRKNPRIIQDIKNPCLEMQLEAVNMQPMSIMYIEDPYLEVQLEAVNIHGFLIQFIKNPCLEVQLAAIRRDINSIRYIKNPHKEVQIKLLENDEKNINYLLKYLNLYSEEKLLELDKIFIKSLINCNLLTDSALNYLSKNGDKEIKTMIMEYKLSK